MGYLIRREGNGGGGLCAHIENTLPSVRAKYHYTQWDNMYMTSQIPRNQPSRFKSLDLAAIWILPIIWSQVVSILHNIGISNKQAAKI